MALERYEFIINYLHSGAPKQWYVIPPDHRERFERFCQSCFPHQFKECTEYLRHKSFILSPSFLRKNYIPVSSVLQKKEEFIVTFPYSYHLGYNLGYNCAEATNFAIKRWTSIGRRAKFCKCIPDSVRIDISKFLGVDEALLSLPVKKNILCVLCGKPETDSSLFCKNSCIHISCATHISEVVINKDLCCDISKIPLERRKLKCIFCDYDGGACIQCSKSKCYKAFHVTCAFDNNLYQKSDSELNFSFFFCKQHDPLLRTFQRDRIHEHEGNVCNQIDQNHMEFFGKWSDGNYYPGKVVKDYRKRNSCLLEFFDGCRKALKYRNMKSNSPN
jgi:hypothetical protein